MLLARITDTIRKQTKSSWPQSKTKIPSFPGFSRAIIVLSRCYQNTSFGNLAAFWAIFSHIFTAHAQKWLF